MPLLVLHLPRPRTAASRHGQKGWRTRRNCVIISCCYFRRTALAFSSSMNSCTNISSLLSIAAMRRTSCGQGTWVEVAGTTIPAETTLAGRGGGGGVDGQRFLGRRGGIHAGGTTAM